MKRNRLVIADMYCDNQREQKNVSEKRAREIILG